MIPENLTEGQLLSLLELLVEQRFTQPPPRYTESTLVKILNVKFSAKMESNLDKIEQHKAGYEETLTKFYQPFKTALEKAKEQKKEIKNELVEKTDIICDKCGRPMVLRWGKNGRFYACSGFPECKNTKPIEEPQVKQSDEICDVCGAPMVIKRGRFGEFLACSNYPKCKNTRPISSAAPIKKGENILLLQQLPQM